MKTSTIVISISIALLPLPPTPFANAQSISVSNDELDSLKRAVCASERETWWPAVHRLGILASEDDALRDEIWHRAHVNTLGMRFVRIEPGTFTMGPDMHRVFANQTPHQVKITRPFFMAVTEVTNDQFRAVFPDHRADQKYSPDGDSPAVRITWKQADAFCKRLSDQEGAVYRLPTEAEWEYACRAGRTTWYSFGSLAVGMEKYGWCLGDRTSAAPVALLLPNDWGLYDMHGNAFEWVQDYHSNDYYSWCAAQGTTIDPQGPVSGSTHVLRSSGWQVDNAMACTCTARFPLPTFNKRPFDADAVGMRETIGFRIVREASDVEAQTRP